MPPPTVVDPWLAGRHFGIVIDAGSSGSRLQIYSWKDPVNVLADQGSAVAQSLPKVEKGTRIGEDWVQKVEPGISSFADNPEDVAGYLRPLLKHARDQVPPSLQPDTPIFLLATAGMRLLPPEKQAAILHETCQFFLLHSHFKIDAPSAAGPCGSSVRIITGEEEGLFGWIAVNYLMDGFTGSADQRTTYGFLDMGGASTQIAFEPSKAHEEDSKSLIDVRLRLLGGEEIHHRVFVTTWLGYGTNQARERYVGQAIDEFEVTRSQDDSSVDNDVVPDPCLPKNLNLTETPVHLGPSSEHANKSHRLIGTGSFDKCMQKTSSLLNKTAPCPDSPCLMNGVHVPPIDFSVSHFIGVSEYWYSSEHVFGLGGAYDFVQYERAAEKFCSRSWTDIVKEHEQSRLQHRPTGDGEVQKDGQVVEVGKWGPEVELSRLEMQCFKAAWIANVLYEGIGMPRIVDPGGNSTTDGEKVVAQAEKKGLGRPTFQSVDTVGDIAISWTLGKMVLEASKEVPLKSKSDRPLVDPLDEIPQTPDFPIKPIRPPFLEAIEDRISPHLPSSLTRTSLGFSPVLLLFYATVILILALVAYPLRRNIRSVCMRSIRNAAKRDTSMYMMEEGKPLNGNGFSGSRPPSPTSTTSKLLRPLRRMFSGSRPSSRLTILTGNNGNNANGKPRLSLGTLARASPIRTSSLPTGLSSSSAASISRSPSPSPGFVEDAAFSYMSNGASSLSSRSRNSSHANLSALAPRPGAMSRASTAYYTPDDTR